MPTKIHTRTFAVNKLDGQWRGRCTCGWFWFGSREEVQTRADSHDTEWEVVPDEQAREYVEGWCDGRGPE